MPNCRRILVKKKTPDDRESIIGEIAHIKGEKPSSPRYDSGMAVEERNSYQNLVFVCASCHKLIDDQPNTYAVGKLHEIKAKHEKWILESTENEVTNVTFPELRDVIEYLTSAKVASVGALALIPPRDKIDRNSLSPTVERLITMGMAQVKQVADFINSLPDIEFGNRLKQVFVAEYQKLKNQEDLSGDDLFNGLVDFASKGAADFAQRAAGLSVLVYLFEKCEVFEK